MINKEIIQSKYRQMKEAGLEIDFLDQNIFGQIMVFINQEPEDEILSLKVGEDMVYVGTN